VALALAVLAYTVARSARISITHDEAITYLVHATAPWRGIFAFNRYLASNNHLLNTVLMKLLVGVFGSAELVLRTPALLGHVLYLVAVLRIVRRHFDGPRLVLATAVLVTNPMLLDFFSCARGYALGVGLAMLGLERLLARWTQGVAGAGRGSGAAAVAYLTAALLANIAFANLLLAAMATAVLIDLGARLSTGATRRTALLGTLRALLVPSLPAAAVLAVVYRPEVMERILKNVSWWGGKRGFWADTVGSLDEYVLYGQPWAEALMTPLALVVALVVLVSAGLALRALKRRAQAPLGLALAGLVSTLVLVALAMVAQFVSVGRPYAVDRSAIYLVPAFLLLAVLSWEHLRVERSTGLCFARGALALFLCALTLQGASCLNLTHNHYWQFDAHTRDAVHAVRDDIGPKRLGRPYTWGVHWVFEPAIDYYLVREGITWIRSPDRSDPDGEFDYYYLLPEENQGLVEKRSLSVLASYPLSKSILAKRP
jgi:hypothetical protein